MANNFSITKSWQENIAIISLNGYLDAHTAPEFEKALQAELELKRFRIVVDCHKLVYISSAGIGVFMSLIDHIRENGGDIKICCLSAELKEILDIVNFIDIIEVSADLPAAVKSFG